MTPKCIRNLLIAACSLLLLTFLFTGLLPTVTAQAPQVTSAVTLSAQQQQTVELLGWPHAFAIRRIEESPGQHARYEAWTWFDSEITYIFVDGEFRFWEPAAGLVPGMPPTTLRPTAFVLGESPETVRAALNTTQWEYIELLDLIDDAEGYTADGVAVSFHKDGLTAVETWMEAR